MILDTCAISEMLKPQRNQGFTQWLSETDLNELAITTFSITETLFGVNRLPDGKRKRTLVDVLHSLFAELTILDQNQPAAELAAQILSAQERTGHPMRFADAAIAGIALHQKQTLVTRDRDFDGIRQQPGLGHFSMINPWS